MADEVAGKFYSKTPDQDQNQVCEDVGARGLPRDEKGGDGFPGGAGGKMRGTKGPMGDSFRLEDGARGGLV